MKKLVSLFLTLCVLLSLAIPALGESIPATFLYVATDGNDTNAGTIDAPFQTLQAAIKASRALDGTVVINMRGGTYQVTETITLTEEDHDLVIRAYQDEDVVLTGGTELSLADFKPCEGTAFLDALVDQSVRENILCANILELGVTDMGEIKAGHASESYMDGRMEYAPTLSFNSSFLPIARYPNSETEYLYTDTILRDGLDPADVGDPHDTATVQYTVKDAAERFAKWKWEDVFCQGYFAFEWFISFGPSQYDADSRSVISVIGNDYYPKHEAVMSNRRVKFFNVPEEMDMAGEWYLDRETGVLYLIPTEEMTQDGKLIFTGTEASLISMNAARNVTLQGITLMGTTGYGVDVENCSDVLINDCESKVIGRSAVHFDNCYRSGVENSYFHDLGGSCVIFDNCGDRTTLISSECFVTNCHFERFTQQAKCYAPAIHPSNTIGVTISHCLFNDAPHSAILTVGNNDPAMELTIEYCEFYNLCTDTADCGVFYSSRRWDTMGDVIRYNYFHDIYPVSSARGDGTCNVIYLDEMMTGVQIYGNVFYKTTRPLQLGGGRYNTFSNNLILDCWSNIATDDRLISGTPSENESRLWGVTTKIAQMPYKEGVWAEKYPELVNILEDQPTFPKYNVITNNVTVDSFGPQMTPTISLGVKTFGTIKDNVNITTTDGFVDYANQDFTLKEDSEIFTLIPDFEPIPFNEIGLYDYTVEDVYVEAQ